jgi:hypothetical protein
LNSIDYPALMQILSRPRPSGSLAERETLLALQSWLKARSLPWRLQAFTLYPYFFICTGLWMICAHSLLALAVWLGWGWFASLAALLGISGGLLDTAFDLPLVTWPGRTRGQNLLVEFEPAQPERELVISAHYDSKTELFDHQTRAFFVRSLPTGLTIAILLGMLAPLEKSLGPNLAQPLHSASVLLTLPLLFLVWGLGLNLAMGRLRREKSQGAVDNGAACAILLGLAQTIDDLQSGGAGLKRTRLTLALFGGEEVNMQGSRAYVRGRPWRLPTAALNLEILGQDGAYVTWQQDGTALKRVPCDPALNQAIARAVVRVTGTAPLAAGLINSDGYSFLRAGIPAATLGSYDKKLEERGFHLPGDNLARVQMERLPEAVKILANFIAAYDEAQPA